VSPGACPAEPAARNSSVGVAEINLLRLLNTTGLVDDLDWPSYESLVKEFLTRDVLAGRPGSAPLRLPPEDRHWVEQRGKQIVDSLRAAGYHVEGDLTELLPAPADGAASRHPDQPADDELLAASLYALAATLRLVARERAQAARPPTIRAAVLSRFGHHPVLRWLLRPYRRVRALLRTLAAAARRR
jgi:hypothetical protein